MKYIIIDWCDAPAITDALTAQKIPYASYVLSGTKIKIEINAGDLPRALNIYKNWEG